MKVYFNQKTNMLRIIQNFQSASELLLKSLEKKISKNIKNLPTLG